MVYMWLTDMNLQQFNEIQYVSFLQMDEATRWRCESHISYNGF